MWRSEEWLIQVMVSTASLWMEKEMAFEEGRGHDYEIDGDHYFSGYGDQRKLDQSLVNLQGLAKGYHQATLASGSGSQ